MQPEYLRAPAVCTRYGISRSTLYARIADGFPKPVHLLGGRCAVYVESKFGSGQLSGPQRAAQSIPGNDLTVHYWD